MGFLFLRVVFNLAFSQLLKMAQERDGELLPAALVNYLIASAVALLFLLLGHPPSPQPVSVLLGIATGVTYAVSLLGLEIIMGLSGVSIAVAILNLSVLVPTAAAILFFHERPDAWQVMGIVAALIALPLLSRSRARLEAPTAPFPTLLAGLFMLFFVTGASGVLMKALQANAPRSDYLFYGVALFIVSSLVIGFAVCVRRSPWGPNALPIGSLVGVTNYLQLFFSLQALSVMQAAIFFPASSALTVVLNTLLAVRFWGEKLDFRAQTGIILAILAAMMCTW
jgi:drug/metabolite transporter (DMT)-like permease